MDFFASQQQARRRTALLCVYFVLAVLAIAAALYAVGIGCLLYYEARISPWQPEVALGVLLFTLVVVGCGSLYKTTLLAAGGKVVAESLGGRLVHPASTDPLERRLLNVVEEMAIASGVPVPPVYLLAGEQGINAFAAGFTPSDAVVGVTRGTIELLSRDELQGVIAHEFSHILNGDMRLNIRLMGLLHGILLIALIGYVLMRTGGRSSSAVGSESKKGGNPLPLIGLALYIIGYVGVFFGHLIKAAVSRQREYLADASAVQFTRNPEGIAGALKKIGGLVFGSRLKNERAEEASHLYFANGLAEAWFALLATHPPLADRVRRIDPRFDGAFPKLSPRDIVSAVAEEGRPPRRVPSWVPGAEGTIGPPVVALAEGAGTPAAAERLVDRVGAPRPEDLEQASALLVRLPEGLREATRHRNGARAVIYAVLVASDPATRAAQLAQLDADGESDVRRAFDAVAAEVAALDRELRLPLVELTLPSLKRLSPPQYRRFRESVRRLIEADRQVSVFEFSLERLVFRHLDPHFVGPRTAGPRAARLGDVLAETVRVLSVLAHAGHAETAAAVRSFHAAVELLDAGRPVDLLARGSVSMDQFDRDLNRLADAAPAVQRRLLEAAAACVSTDGRVTPAEGELLRLTADALGCPLPPILPRVV